MAVGDPPRYFNTEIRLASALVHLCEFISEDGCAEDLTAAAAAIADPHMREHIDSMAEDALLPVRRDGAHPIKELLGDDNADD